MRLLNLSFESPAENLALDEALLESVASGAAVDALRFWESPTYFVVIGSGQRWRNETRHFHCLRDGVPILRRCSAGGAVLQGPGCLNYALALSHETFPETADLHGSYDYILNRVAEAMRPLGVVARRAGVSDLAVDGLKVSGNAQRRKRNACLHHGTLLYRVDLTAMARYLQEPDDRPDYRGDRTHAGFVGALPATADQLRAAIQEAFAPDSESIVTPTADEMDAARRLALEKYSRDAWTYRR